jgi:hypothetical protein
LTGLFFVGTLGSFLLTPDRLEAACPLPSPDRNQFNTSYPGKVILIGRLPQQHYVVIVPGTQATLQQVRNYVDDAFLITSRLGNYVQAGAFFDWEQAKCLSDHLRSRRIDAQIVYFR